MSNERYDVVTFRKTKNGKVFAVRLGSASPRDDGGFSLWLDAMPAPGPSGQYEIVVCKPRERSASPAHGGDDMNDSIPF